MLAVFYNTLVVTSTLISVPWAMDEGVTIVLALGSPGSHFLTQVLNFFLFYNLVVVCMVVGVIILL